MVASVETIRSRSLAMRVVLTLLVSCLATGCLARHAWPVLVERSKSDAPAVLISDVSVFDGVSGTLSEHQDVVTPPHRTCARTAR
jgi:hypothetical protein